MTSPLSANTLSDVNPFASSPSPGESGSSMVGISSTSGLLSGPIGGRIGENPNSNRIGSNNNGLIGSDSGGIVDLEAQRSEQERLNTLDEPVSDTILRDLKQVGVKLKHVLIPKGSVQELRDWDLWGPLLLCLLLACSLSFSSGSDQAASIFAAVFVIVWCGAGIVTLNAALLGGNISFLQSVCVLGYCIAPLNVASLLCHIWHNNVFQFVVVISAFLWATKASVGFMSQLVAVNRRALGVYPVLLFYLTISWMILVQ